METITLQGNLKTISGTKEANKIRQEGNVPCVLYGGKENIHFSARMLDIRDAIYTSDFKIIDITVEGKSHKAIVKDFQFHPVTDKLIHVDFQELVDNRPLIYNIPVKLTGFAKGVQSGGKLEQKLREITVKALPQNMKDVFEVDVTSLELGKSIKIKDVDNKGLEILNSLNNPIASVVIPRALRSKQSSTEAAK